MVCTFMLNPNLGKCISYTLVTFEPECLRQSSQDIRAVSFLNISATVDDCGIHCGNLHSSGRVLHPARLRALAGDEACPYPGLRHAVDAVQLVYGILGYRIGAS